MLASTFNSHSPTQKKNSTEEFIPNLSFYTTSASKIDTTLSSKTVKNYDTTTDGEIEQGPEKTVISAETISMINKSLFLT